MSLPAAAPEAAAAVEVGTRRSPRPFDRPGALLFQIGLVLALAALGLFVANNVAANLDRLNLHSGLGFLARPAGFAISMHLIAYSEQSSYGRAFLVALLNTLLLAGVSSVLATLLGFALGLLRLSANRLAALAALAYVEIVRNVPLLLQLFFWYFAVLGTLPLPRRSLAVFGFAYLNRRGLYLAAPQAAPSFGAFAAALVLGIACWYLLARAGRRRRVESGRASALGWGGAVLALLLPGLVALVAGAPIAWDRPRLAGFNFSGGIVVIPEFVAMAIGMSIFGAAFIAELVRGGVLSVPRGQAEAGLSLGLSRWRVYRQIVLPQALRAILPPLVSQYILILKNSSLGAAIAYPDLMLIFAGTVLNQTGQPLEIMAITMATYLALCLGIAVLGNALNRRVQLVER